MGLKLTSMLLKYPLGPLGPYLMLFGLIASLNSVFMVTFTTPNPHSAHPSVHIPLNCTGLKLVKLIEIQSVGS